MGVGGQERPVRAGPALVFQVWYPVSSVMFLQFNTCRCFYCIFGLQNSCLGRCHFPLALLVFCKKLVSVWSIRAMRGESKTSALSNSSRWSQFSSRMRCLAKPSFLTDFLLVFWSIEKNLLALHALLCPSGVLVNVLIEFMCVSFCPFRDLRNPGKTSSTFHRQMFSWTCLCFALSS